MNNINNTNQQFQANANTLQRQRMIAAQQMARNNSSHNNQNRNDNSSGYYYPQDTKGMSPPTTNQDAYQQLLQRQRQLQYRTQHQQQADAYVIPQMQQSYVPTAQDRKSVV